MSILRYLLGIPIGGIRVIAAAIVGAVQNTSSELVLNVSGEQITGV